MDFQKVIIIGVDFKDFHKNSTSQHIFAEVVLIDKTHTSLNPILYQFKDEIMSDNRNLFSFNQNSFLMVGEVEKFDKKKKLIFLTNQNTVSYNYLIIANGNNALSGTAQELEFIAGLQALIDAIKIKKELPFFFDTEKKIPKKNLNVSEASHDIKPKTIGQIANHYLIKDYHSSQPFPGLDRRLFEVQV